MDCGEGVWRVGEEENREIGLTGGLRRRDSSRVILSVLIVNWKFSNLINKTIEEKDVHWTRAAAGPG